MNFSHSFSAKNLAFSKLVHFFALACIVLLLPSYAASEQPDSKEIEQLDIRYKELSSDIYRELAKSRDKHSADIDVDIEKIQSQVLRLINEKDHFSAILYLYANFDKVEDNVDNQIVFQFIEILLRHNEYNPAHSLYQQIVNNSEQFFIANAALKFAKYHSDRREWQQTLSFLDTDLEELSRENTNHAYLLRGIALQHLRKHRDAIKVYEKVTNDSIYYPTAQLNIAVAHIRQDWWTDAHITIKQLFKNTPSIQQHELGDRLHLMLGYSLLGKQYFRESRDSFRNIGLNSRYANKALMGISLAAISQNDSVGALNALSILKETNSYELVVEESYLLLPHIYKKLEQYMTANEGYTNAIAYYQGRINALSHELETISTYKIHQISFTDESEFLIAETPLKFTELYPQHFLDNFFELKQLKNSVGDSRLNQKINMLYQDYDQLFNRMIKALLKIRIEALKSYLSQSHYGLAQLYDKNSE